MGVFSDTATESNLVYRSCNQLIHLNLGSCNAIGNYDDLAIALAKHCS